ncbi:hypothetical protein BD413DRAFT_186257 [Trametes elegans]|nr:hypothetical protein BD413DRAFT_186257 [Trametes elegans]
MMICCVSSVISFVLLFGCLICLLFYSVFGTESAIPLTITCVGYILYVECVTLYIPSVYRSRTRHLQTPLAIRGVHSEEHTRRICLTSRSTVQMQKLSRRFGRWPAAGRLWPCTVPGGAGWTVLARVWLERLRRRSSPAAQF